MVIVVIVFINGPRTFLAIRSIRLCVCVLESVSNLAVSGQLRNFFQLPARTHTLTLRAQSLIHLTCDLVTYSIRRNTHDLFIFLNEFFCRTLTTATDDDDDDDKKG